MKKIIILFLLLPLLSIAQHRREKKEPVKDSLPKFTIGINGAYSKPMAFGITFERLMQRRTEKSNFNSFLTSVSYATMNYNDGFFNLNGTGFELAIGNRKYWEKGKAHGFYTESYFATYGSIHFNDTVNGIPFDGTYSYFSVFNDNVGFKIRLSKGVALEPYAGFMWKWGIKGSGMVDNIHVDNFVFRGGIKLSFIF